MTDYLLDTNTASHIMMGRRATLTALRRSSARQVSISTVSQSELLFGAHSYAGQDLMPRVRRFLDRMVVHDWDQLAAETHALVRAQTRRKGRGAGSFDIMIAAHALALDLILVTSDQAIATLRVDGLRVVEW